METIKRSLLKTIIWRLTGSGATFTISYIVTGSFETSGTIAIIQLTANTILYFIYERIWNKVNWGKINK